MQALWYIIAVLLLPFGKVGEKTMMKILACLDFMDIFGFAPKEMADMVILNVFEKHKWLQKVFGFCWWTLFTGGLFLYVMLIMWCFKLFVKIFKFIFRRKRA